MNTMRMRRGGVSRGRPAACAVRSFERMDRLDRDVLESAAARNTVNRRTLVLAPGLALLARGIASVDARAGASTGTPAPAGTPVTTGVPEWLATIEDLVRIETWRAADGSNEDQVVARLGQIKAKLGEVVDAFVASHHLA
ncbi:MAG TPA: hypothetical protein VFL91_07035, partial [Thermomicrobiales bacterium]|nr:hypothetical protein [Thermomicrobiales bacterium]